MTLPKIILFDYGQTLVNEARFDGEKGTAAVLKYATKNKYNLTAAQVQEVWYIGDNYTCDVKGARNAGLFPVWYIGAIDLPYEEKEDVLIVRSWAEL